MPTVSKSGDGAAVGQVGDLVRDYTVRSVQRVCSILNLLQHSIDGVSLVDVGAATELRREHVQEVAVALTTRALIAGAAVAPTDVATGRAQPGS